MQRFGNVVQLNGGAQCLDVAFKNHQIMPAQGPAEAPEEGWGMLPLRLVQSQLLALLDERNLLSLASVNRWFRALCLDGALWMELFAARFGFLPPFAQVSGYWLSRFFHQRREVASFGSVALDSPPPDEKMTRVVMMGPLNAGKTTLLNSLQQSRNQAAKSSLFVRTVVASGYVGGSLSLCSVKFWDIPGDPRNRSISSVYCQTAHCICFVFDAESDESLAQVKDWVLGLKMSIKSRDYQLVLICNKYTDDGESRERFLQAMAFARQEKMQVLTVNSMQDNGYEFKLFIWRLAGVVQKINFIL